MVNNIIVPVYEVLSNLFHKKKGLGQLVIRSTGTESVQSFVRFLIILVILKKIGRFLDRLSTSTSDNPQ